MRWEQALDDASAMLLRSQRPLVFVLGAGCSISSGAPTTPEAFQALDAALQRLSPQERAFAPRQTDAEKRDLLRPEFANFSPGIGYHLLASLGRVRQVYVINFNWDPGVEKAAAALGVDCAYIDGESAQTWDAFRLPTGDCGIRVLHVHGTLDGNPLARLSETCHYRENIRGILSELWAFDKLLVGIDLGYELDFYNFLQENGQQVMLGKSAPWYFSRGRSVDDHLHKLQRIDASSHASITPDFDFDLFMVGLAGELAGLPYDEFASHVRAMPQQLRDVCLPENTALMPMVFPAKVAVAAEYGAGATTLANLLAYFKFVLGLVQLPPMNTEGLAPTKAELGNATHAGGPGSRRVMVFDAILEGEHADDASMQQLAELAQRSAHASLVLVAPLASVNRLRAGGSDPVGSAFDLVITMREGQPYTPGVLRRFAQRLQVSPAFMYDVETGLVHHPVDCRRQRVGVRSSSNQPAARAELAANANLRILATFGRLIELSAREKTVAELERVAHLAVAAVSEDTLEQYLSFYKFEGTDWFQVVPSKRALLDALLKEDAPNLASRLEGLDLSLLSQLKQWLLFLELSQGGTAERLEREQFRRISSSLLDERWGLDALGRLLDYPFLDSWGATNLAYALVGGWERFDAGKARVLLDKLLGRRDVRGCYAVAEAALFLGTATPREVWVELESCCWKLLRADVTGQEMCLVVDAFLWRPPPPGWESLLREYFASMTRDAKHAGSLRFFAAFHMTGLVALCPDWQSRSDGLHWTEEQSRMAAWLVEWHFVHYAFSRAVSFRFGRNDKYLLCRGLHPQPTLQPQPSLRQLLTSLLRFGSTAGAGFLAACMEGGRHDWVAQAEGQQLMLELLTSSPEVDVLAACGLAGYELPRRSQQLRQVFSKGARRRAVVDLVARGATLDGQQFSHQQFQFAHDVHGLWRALELRLPNVEREQLHLDSHRELFMREVEVAAQAMHAKADAKTAAALARVVESIRTGTRLDDLEQAIPARGLQVPLGRHVLEIMLHMELDDAAASS